MLVFISSLLAVSPALHQWLHQDATQSSHQCAITLLEQQQILSSDPHPILIALDLGLIGFAPLIKTPQTLSVDYTSSPSRAPPSFFFSLAIVG